MAQQYVAWHIWSNWCIGLMPSKRDGIASAVPGLPLHDPHIVLDRLYAVDAACDLSRDSAPGNQYDLSTTGNYAFPQAIFHNSCNPVFGETRAHSPGTTLKSTTSPPAMLSVCEVK